MSFSTVNEINNECTFQNMAATIADIFHNLPEMTSKTSFHKQYFLNPGIIYWFVKFPAASMGIPLDGSLIKNVIVSKTNQQKLYKVTIDIGPGHFSSTGGRHANASYTITLTMLTLM